MHWRDLIKEFPGLAKEFVETSSQTKAAAELAHDKKTIKGWCDGAEPSAPKEVGWLLRSALKAGVDITPFQTFAPIYDFTPMLSYESKIHQGPPDLSWLTNIRLPPLIKTKLFDLELDTPFGLSSSPLVGSEKWAGLLLDLGYGLSCFKTCSVTPRDLYNPPQIAFLAQTPNLSDYDPTSPPDVVVDFDRRFIQGSIPNPVNSIGGPSDGTVAWQETYERIRKHPRGHFVGISVIGDGSDRSSVVTDFENALKKAREVRPPFIELNLSCPVLEKEKEIWQDSALIREICEKARTALTGTSILLIIKLPYLLKPQMKELLKVAGRFPDAVSFRNTLKVRPFVRLPDGRVLPAFLGREFGGLSGPASFQLTRRGIEDLIAVRTELGQDFRIIATGGVSTAAHVIELQNAGADIVQACTAPMFDPLLAWKVRFELKKLEPRISSAPAIRLAEPRNQCEVESFRNLFEAQAELNRRRPQHPVDYDRVCTAWNVWMQQRPHIPEARAHRMSPRTCAQWLKDLTS